MLQNRLPLQAWADSQISPLEPTLADVLAAVITVGDRAARHYEQGMHTIFTAR